MTRLTQTASSLIGMAIVAAALTGCASTLQQPAAQDLFSPENLPKWQLTRGYEKRPAWVFEDGAYTNVNSCVAYPTQFTDFIFECEFLFQGKGEGGIQLRGDATATRGWEVGYELDIDFAQDKKHGHVHFPVKPKPYSGEAQFTAGQWHAVRVELKGPKVVVHLDGKQVLQFEDSQYLAGQICLQGEKGGVKYRNVRVTELK